MYCNSPNYGKAITISLIAAVLILTSPTIFNFKTAKAETGSVATTGSPAGPLTGPGNSCVPGTSLSFSFTEGQGGSLVLSNAGPFPAQLSSGTVGLTSFSATGTTLPGGVSGCPPGPVPAGQPVSVSGTCGEGATVTVNGVGPFKGTVYCSPDTIIDSAVDANGVPIQDGGTTSNTITFTYHGTSGTTVFACGIGSISHNGFCNGSPITFPGPADPSLGPGTYTFIVRADNGGVSDPSPAKFTFTISQHSSDTTPPTVTATPAGGIFNKAQSVTLTSNEGSTTIYYTTDGSDPTISSTKYSGPIPIGTEGTTTLKFFGVDAANNKEAVQSASYTIDTTPPTVTATPAGSTFNTDQSVRLTASEQGATIYYTTDGSNPTTSSTVYDSTTPIAITSDTTLKFFAVDRATNVGNIQTETYAFDRTGPTVAASPSGTLSNTAQSVSLSSTDSDLASIYYTINGADPDKTTGTLYTPGSTIPIDSTASGDGTVTLKAIGYDKLGNAGPILTETYTFDRTGPSITVSPAGALSNTAQSVTLSSTDSDLDKIYYTLDGNNPTTSSSLYSGPVSVDSTSDGPITLKAVAYDKLGNAGPVATETYTFDRTGPSLTLDPSTGLSNKAQTVAASSTAADLDSSAIYYTTDGSDPSRTNGQQVPSNGQIAVDSTAADGNVILKVIAYDKLGNAGPISTGTYTFDRTGPTVAASPKGTLANTPQSVTLSSSDSDIDKIYYTTDGSDPSTSSTLYTGGPIAINTDTDGTITLKAIGYDKLGNPGNVITETYTFDRTPPTVTASPKGALTNTPQSVSLSSTDADLDKIFYTTDGSNPTTSSTQYSGPIQISSEGTTTLKFFGVDKLGNQETVQSESYAIDTTPPQVTGTADRTPDSNTFYTHAVTVDWSGSDSSGGSGIKSCDSPTTYSSPDGKDVKLTGSCIDNAGNRGTGTVTINYDANAPTSTTISSSTVQNGGKSKLNTIAFTLGGTDTVGVATYLCSLDGATFVQCPGTVQYTGLADGTHTFAAKAVDAAGNVATTAQQFSWTIDTVSPVVSVPANIVVEATSPSGATVTYAASAKDNLDGALNPSCNPPSGYTFPLSTTTVTCSATDSAGNQGSASFSVTVRDTTPPDTRILSIQTSGSGPSNTVTITLQGTDAVGIKGFMCAFDSPTFNPCSSTVVLSNVRSGGHVFAASAIDTSGNVDQTPAAQPFTISGK